jgi:epoxyqueuosine reductase
VGLTLSALLPSTKFSALFPQNTHSILLLVSTGQTFFEVYQRAALSEPDPLDSYTKRLVHRLVGSSLPEALAVYFPFEEPFLPFLRLGIEAGLGLPGPLGIMVSPVYGPWFALRAAVALPFEAVPLPPQDVCLTCPAPCIAACPAGAVRREGLQVEACGEARHISPCGERCVAREACPVGVVWRYQEAAIHFHHRGASLFFPKK